MEDIREDSFRESLLSNLTLPEDFPGVPQLSAIIDL
jgi:hypothetical protein